jgi:thioredoxin reductase (NADPH)
MQLRYLLLEVAQLQGLDIKNSKLYGLKLATPQGAQVSLACDLLLVKLGLSPQLGPLADWGLDISRKQLSVNTEDFSTDVPGLFAIGDVITYPGKKKLILSGFHEAALASFGVAKWVLQKDRIPFEYTSASSLLQERLGVK